MVDWIKDYFRGSSFAGFGKTGHEMVRREYWDDKRRDIVSATC